jgi:hypothetical protein
MPVPVLYPHEVLQNTEVIAEPEPALDNVDVPVCLVGFRSNHKRS